MDTPRFIQPPPWLLPTADDDESNPGETLVPATIPAFRPMPLGTRPVPPRPPAPETRPAAVSHAPEVAAVPSHSRWRLLLNDGQAVDLAGAVVLGRDPAPVAEHPGAALVRVRDLARSVSKTHAVVESDGDRLWVTDLHSTNGVSVTRADGTVTGIAPGGRGELTGDCRLLLGEFGIDVRLDHVPDPVLDHVPEREPGLG